MFLPKALAGGRGDICAAMLKILCGDGMIPSVNSAYIALIPKICNPTRVTNFFISLCNVMYKLVSKVLTKRLKPHMHTLISKKLKRIHPKKTHNRQYNDCS